MSKNKIIMVSQVSCVRFRGRRKNHLVNLAYLSKFFFFFFEFHIPKTHFCLKMKIQRRYHYYIFSQDFMYVIMFCSHYMPFFSLILFITITCLLFSAIFALHIAFPFIIIMFMFYFYCVACWIFYAFYLSYSFVSVIHVLVFRATVHSLIFK